MRIREVRVVEKDGVYSFMELCREYNDGHIYSVKEYSLPARGDYADLEESLSADYELINRAFKRPVLSRDWLERVNERNTEKAKEARQQVENTLAEMTSDSTPVHNFTLSNKAIKTFDWEDAEHFHMVVPDGTLYSHNNQIFVEVHREASSRLEAIESARDDVRKVFPDHIFSWVVEDS